MAIIGLGFCVWFLCFSYCWGERVLGNISSILRAIRELLLLVAVVSNLGLLIGEDFR